MQITDCVDQIFQLDYILYTPSFSTLATKPPPGGPPPSQMTTFITSTSTTLPVVSTTKSTPVAAIVGGVMGGVVCLLLVFLLFLYRTKKSNPRTLSQPMATRSAFFSRLTLATSDG